MDKQFEALLQEVEALCHVYVAPGAESEQWIETCRRFDRLDRLAKKIRKAQKKA